jgi:hypothetical protein
VLLGQHLGRELRAEVGVAPAHQLDRALADAGGDLVVRRSAPGLCASAPPPPRGDGAPAVATSASTATRWRSRSLIITQPKPALPVPTHGRGE